MYTYHLYLSTKRTNKSSLAPIYAKITIGGKCYERSSEVFVNPKSWNRQFKRVQPSDPNATLLNERISIFENKLISFKETANSIAQLDKLLKPETTVQQETNPPLIVVLDAYMKRQEAIIDKPEGITFSTYKTYQYRRKNFVSFLECIGKPQLPIESFDGNTGERFKSWLYDNEFTRSHVNKHLKLVRTLIKFAKFEYGSRETNFMLTPIKQGSPAPIIYLTKDELYKIEKKVYLSSLHQKTADLFLLQCYTGMGYSDVVCLNSTMIEKHFGRKFIHYSRKKTGIKGIVPLHPTVSGILKRNGDKAPNLANQLYNRILKEIASLVGIDKHLTSHVGRKTFGTIQINEGQSIEAVTKMLGKTNTKETAKIYAEVSHQLIIGNPVNTSQSSLFQ